MRMPTSAKSLKAVMIKQSHFAEQGSSMPLIMSWSNTKLGMHGRDPNDDTKHDESRAVVAAVAIGVGQEFISVRRWCSEGAI